MLTSLLVAFGAAFAVVFVAELGHKSQLLALTFSTRYKALATLISVTIAAAVMLGAAVLVGTVLRVSLPTRAISVVAGPPGGRGRMRPMPALSFGISVANAGPFARPANAAALGALAEAHGFDSLWTVEHVVIPKGYASPYPYNRSGRAPGAETSDIPDPLVWLAFVAARTTTIKLATGILILPQRNPVVTAKEVATLDVLSNGRAVLGVGSGWLAEEFEALGVPFADRGDRLDDHIRAMRALWHDQEASYTGRFSSFEACIALPRPVQASVPIVIGGHTARAARRAGELGDGFFPVKGSVDELGALLAVMRRAAEAAGRNPDMIELTTSARDHDTTLRLADIGFRRFVIPPPAYDHEGLRAGLERYEAEVIAKM